MIIDLQPFCAFLAIGMKFKPGKYKFEGMCLSWPEDHISECEEAQWPWLCMLADTQNWSIIIIIAVYSFWFSNCLRPPPLYLSFHSKKKFRHVYVWSSNEGIFVAISMWVNMGMERKDECRVAQLPLLLKTCWQWWLVCSHSLMDVSGSLVCGVHPCCHISCHIILLGSSHPGQHYCQGILHGDNTWQSLNWYCNSLSHCAKQ